MTNDGTYTVPLKEDSEDFKHSLQDSAQFEGLDQDNINVELDPPQNPTTRSLLSRLSKNRAKNWFTRNFSSMSKGGIRSSIFTLFSGSVGAGVLSLPKVTSTFGLFLGVTLILLGGILNYCTFMILNKSVEISKKRSYPNVCSYFFGKKWAKVFSAALLLNNFMACVVYPTVAWSFVETLVHKELNLPILNPETGTFKEYEWVTFRARIIIMSIMAVIMLCINLCKEFSALRYLSVFILLTIIFTIGLAIFQAPQFYEYYSITKIYELNFWPKEVSLNWVSGMATIIFAYSCHSVFFYIRGELRSKTNKRVSKVIKNALSCEISLYLAISIAGYVSLGNQLTPAIFFLRKPLPGMNDVIMNIIKWVFIFVTLLHVPINLFATRDQFYTYFRLKRTNKNHILVTVGLTFASFAIPIVYPDVLGLLGIIGGLCSTSVCIIVPFLLLIRMNEKEGKATMHLKIGILIFAFIGLWSTYISLVGEAD